MKALTIGVNNRITEVTVPTGGSVPQRITNGVTFTAADNTQVVFAMPIIINAGGILMMNGTGALVWVD